MEEQEREKNGMVLHDKKKKKMTGYPWRVRKRRA
jgi:hypothetical protein